MQNKRGQFFLLAAFVIIGVIFSLTTIYTAIETPPEDNTLYDLTNEIKYESGAVIDSGVFNALTDAQRNKNLENLTDFYAFSNPGSDLVILYGNRSEMSAIFYTTQNTGQIGIDFGGGPSTHNVTTTRKLNATFSLSGEEEVTILIDEDVRYTFETRPGEMFFLILKKERQGEQFVASSNS